MLRMRQGRPAEAAELFREVATNFSGEGILSDVRRAARRDLDGEKAFPSELAERATVAYLAMRDGEQGYWMGAFLARFGFPELALQLLSAAVQRNYCSYPVMERDPMLESVRADPSRACHQEFMAYVEPR